MIGWLLDTNVVSSLIARNGAPSVKRWAAEQDEAKLFLSILTVAQYEKGIHNLPGDHPDRVRYQESLASLEARFAGRVLPVTDRVVRLWGQISGRVRRERGAALPVIDTLLAATALDRNLHLVTRNLRDVADSGASVFCPWTGETAAFRIEGPGNPPAGEPPRPKPQPDHRWARASVVWRTAISGADMTIADVRTLLGAKPRPVGWAERRARIEEVGAVTPAARDIALESTVLGGVPAEWSLAPGADPSRALIFLHGGGFCSGSIVSHRRLATEAGRAAGRRVLAPAYRLAPEHPFPAAHDDVLAVWRALLEAGYAPERIAVVGDSAGGALAVALAIRLLQAGEAGPEALWLISPWLDLTQSGATMTSKDGVDPLIHRPYLNELAAAFAPGADLADPRLSVLNADLRGLPPTLIQVGSHEALLADATRLATRLAEADVRVTLEVWPGMIHAFPLWNGILTEGREAIAHAGAFLRGEAP